MQWKLDKLKKAWLPHNQFLQFLIQTGELSWNGCMKTLHLLIELEYELNDSQNQENKIPHGNTIVSIKNTK